MLARLAPIVCALALSACLSVPPGLTRADPDTVYVLQSIDGQLFAARATLSFPADGQIAGSGPCNRFAGEQAADLPNFRPGLLRVTRAACADLPLETAFFRALAAMTRAELTATGLVLSNARGRRMIFAPAP